jgi:hypothetical protein
MFNISFFQSFITLEFQEQYGISDDQMGYYFAALTIAYMVGAIVWPMLLKNMPRKL